MVESWPITWWEFTGDYTEYVDNRSYPILRNIATGELLSRDKLPFGACYESNIDARTLEREEWTPNGYDGKSIVCITPRTSPADLTKKGEWHIDSRANNCDMKNDDIHRCWIRHGTIGDKLHIDKAGNTCGAGAGSIQNAGWHGFLHNGTLSVNG